MRRLDKVLVFICRHTRLSSLPVHVLQFCGRVLLHVALNGLDDLFVIRQIWTIALESNHVECCRSFQGTVNVKVFAGVLGTIEVGGHSTIPIRLRGQKIRIYTNQLSFF